MRPLRLLAALSLPLALGLAACDANDGSTATARIRLTDLATDSLSQATIFLKEVRVVGTDSTETYVVPVNRTINLLRLRDGRDTLLGVVRIPSGSYSGYRLVTGENATVTEAFSGQTYTLKIPSGSTSGIKVQKPFTVEDSTSVLIDFDVNSSLKYRKAGASGKYVLTPVVFVKRQTTDGRAS